MFKYTSWSVNTVLFATLNHLLIMQSSSQIHFSAGSWEDGRSWLSIQLAASVWRHFILCYSFECKSKSRISSTHSLSLPPAAAAAASIAAAHLLLVLLYGVGAVHVVILNLPVDRHVGRPVPSRDFETAIRVLGGDPVVRALQRHGIDDDRAGIVIRSQLGSGNADVTVRVVQREIHGL